MATKKTNNESENNQQEMEQFVQEHINSVPRMWKTRFESFTLEEKVARIKQWEQNRKNIAEYKEKFANPYVAASKGYIDSVINPADTRQFILQSLDVSQHKNAGMPKKKHGIPPF